MAIEPPRNDKWIVVERYPHGGLAAVTKDPVPAGRKIPLVVSSFDWGGRGFIEAEALDCHRSAVIEFPVDTDGDGLPDPWEKKIQQGTIDLVGGTLKGRVDPVRYRARAVRAGVLVTTLLPLHTQAAILAALPRFDHLSATSNPGMNDRLWDRDPYPMAGEPLPVGGVMLVPPDNWGIGMTGDGRTGHDEYRGQYVQVSGGEEGVVLGDSPVPGLTKRNTIGGMMFFPVQPHGAIHVRTDPVFKDLFVVNDAGFKKVRRHAEAYLTNLPLHIFLVSPDHLGQAEWGLPDFPPGRSVIVTLTELVNAYRPDSQGFPDYKAIDSLPVLNGIDGHDPTPYQRALRFDERIVPHDPASAPTWGDTFTFPYGQWRALALRGNSALPMTPNETELSVLFPEAIRFSARTQILVMDLPRFIQAVLAHEGGHSVAMQHYHISHLFRTDVDFTLLTLVPAGAVSMGWRRRSCMVNGLIARRYTSSDPARGSEDARQIAADIANDAANYVTYDTVDITQIRLHAKHR